MNTISPLKMLFASAFLLTFGSRTTHAATRHYDVGDRLTAHTLYTTDGTEKLVSFESPSIIILWSTWSPASLSALDEILDATPKGGIRWQIVPINVDAPFLSLSDTGRVNTAARSAGWPGPVWHDRGYQIMDDWGVLALPTVTITALGGAIDEIEHDWSPILRARLFVLYFGAVSDSFPGIMTPIASQPCRTKAEAARKLWRVGRKESAITLMQDVADSCTGLPNDLARLADWKWSVGDSIRQRVRIETLVQGDHQNAWTLCAQAALADRRGDDTSSVALCLRAIAVDSAFFPAWILLAERSRQIDDSITVRVAYARARELNRFDGRVLSLGARLAESRGDHVQSARLMRAAAEARLRSAVP